MAEILERFAQLRELKDVWKPAVKVGQLWLYQRFGSKSPVAHHITRADTRIESTSVAFDGRYRDGQKINERVVLAAEDAVVRVTEAMLSGRDAAGTWKLLVHEEDIEEWMYPGPWYSLKG